MNKITDPRKGIFQSIRNFFEDQFGWCNHLWICTNEHPQMQPASEAWYWHIDKCNKCPAERAVLGECRTYPVGVSKE